jgi:hypothetical protein
MSEQLPPKPNPQEATVTDPSMLSGNVTPHFDEELYKQKVEFLEGALQEQTTANLSAQREVFVRAVGGHREAERVDVWEAVKKQEAGRAYGEVTHILAEEAPSVTKPDEQKDVFDKVFTSVMLDMRGNASQLNTALELVETYTEWVPDFNPKEAGFDEAKASLTMGLAALQVDQSSKPNYQYAKPERSNLFAQTADGLKQLRRTEAHMFLHYQDFELPPQTGEQPVQQA